MPNLTILCSRFIFNIIVLLLQFVVVNQSILVY